MFLYIETIHANGCLLQSKGRTRKMGKQPRDAENTTRAFFKEYMVNRNVEATLDWLMDDVQWIGTGKGEYSCGKEQVLEALEQVGMKDRATHLPHELSGGEQQRVCVARALINRPAVILADEPTGNLDETNEKIVIDFFHRLHEEGTTLVVVTHDAEVAAQGQRQIILEHGRIAREVTDLTDAPVKGLRFDETS